MAAVNKKSSTFIKFLEKYTFGHRDMNKNILYCGISQDRTNLIMVIFLFLDFYKQTEL